MNMYSLGWFFSGVESLTADTSSAAFGVDLASPLFLKAFSFAHYYLTNSLASTNNTPTNDTSTSHPHTSTHRRSEGVSPNPSDNPFYRPAPEVARSKP